MTFPSRRFGAALTLLLIGVLISATLDPGDPTEEIVSSFEPASAPIEFTARLGRGTLSLSGTTVSTAHEAALTALATEHFGHQHLLTDFRPGVAIPQQWQTQTYRLMYVMAATESANAMLSPTALTIAGITAAPQNLEQRVSFLAESLPADVSLSANITTVADSGSLATLCTQAFGAMDTRGIGFEESSNALKTSSRPMLDRLSEFAFDCPQAVLIITGHSDASGNPDANVALSRRRAQAVADYLIGNGIPAAQLQVVGRGGAMPIADNTTAVGRDRNRRIEISLQ
ncbi:MAG: OmpA family protein [Pseudomonadota bacterium]